VTTTPENPSTLAYDLRALWAEVEVLCSPYDPDLSSVFLEAEDELTPDEARSLLTRVITRIRTGGEAPDEPTRTRLSREVRDIVTEAIARRSSADSLDDAPGQVIGPARTGDDGVRTHLDLVDMDGLVRRPVRPTPVFLGKEVSLEEGFVDVTTLNFWEDNRRLDIDLTNFRRREKREPSVEELKKMLWPRGDGPKEDPYRIRPLADDIAARGVQQAPVIDWWGTAWDGNRRIAACLYVLDHDYEEAEKRRARYIRVWQTDAQATDDQITAIITSLNFGDEHKLPWPEYVRARQVYDAFVDKRDLAASQRVLGDRDETRIRQAVAKEFGIKTAEVTRFCKMVVWAIEFEDYHREQGRDESDILEQTNRLFQYFYELDSGRGDDKLAAKLRDDEGFRAIVFDLMFDGKFKNWSQIRELRRVYETPAALDALKQAHAETSMALGRERVTEAIELARQRSLAIRQAGMADELRRVAKWLNEDVTVALLKKLDPNLLREFRDAARALDGMISSVIDPTPVAVDADD
jgi:hypothetical protein